MFMYSLKTLNRLFKRKKLIKVISIVVRMKIMIMISMIMRLSIVFIPIILYDAKKSSSTSASLPPILISPNALILAFFFYDEFIKFDFIVILKN